MSWVRIDTGAKSDPKFGRVAKALKIRQREALGMFVAVLLELPTHARDGDLADVDDDSLEAWAGWRGKAGEFAAQFRAEFMAGSVVRGWEKHNGAPIRQSDAEAERKRQARAKGPDVPPDVPRDGGQTEGGTGGSPFTVRDVTGRDGTEQPSSSTASKDARALFVLPNRAGVA